VKVCEQTKQSNSSPLQKQAASHIQKISVQNGQLFQHTSLFKFQVDHVLGATFLSSDRKQLGRKRKHITRCVLQHQDVFLHLWPRQFSVVTHKGKHYVDNVLQTHLASWIHMLNALITHKTEHFQKNVKQHI